MSAAWMIYAVVTSNRNPMTPNSTQSVIEPEVVADGFSMGLA
jgi:hypothetical protein